MGAPQLRRLRALVLHRTPVREKDRVVEVFSREEGRLKLLAAGVRRFPSRRAGHLEPLMETAIVVSASSRGESIRDARVLRAFPRLREHLECLMVGYHVAHLLREGTGERLADARLYDAARALLDALDHTDVRVTSLFALSADLQLLRHLGLVPDLFRCSRCRRPLRPAAFTFDERAPSFVCRTCAPATRDTAFLTEAVKLLRLLMRDPVPPVKLVVHGDVVRELTAVVRRLLAPLRVQVGLDVRALVRKW